MDNWLPILDFAVLKGISTSTIRRYIKSGKINFKVEKGKYLILDDGRNFHENAFLSRASFATEPAPKSDSLASPKIQELEKTLARMQEQNDELKMLVAIYEEKLAQQKDY